VAFGKCFGCSNLLPNFDLSYSGAADHFVASVSYWCKWGMAALVVSFSRINFFGSGECSSINFHYTKGEAALPNDASTFTTKRICCRLYASYASTATTKQTACYVTINRRPSQLGGQTTIEKVSNPTMLSLTSIPTNDNRTKESFPPLTKRNACTNINPDTQFIPRLQV
jgi:hypothetical protein